MTLTSPDGGAVKFSATKTPKTGFEPSIFRPLLTIHSLLRGMILPLPRQMSKDVNPIVDKFIFIVQHEPVKRLCSDYFE